MSSDDPTLLLPHGQAVAAIAAGLAGWSLWPRVAGALGPRQLRNRYLTRELGQTKLALLDTRIDIYEKGEALLAIKVGRLKLASWALSLAVLIMLATSIVECAR